jgi:hypothetical protein
MLAAAGRGSASASRIRGAEELLLHYQVMLAKAGRRVLTEVLPPGFLLRPWRVAEGVRKRWHQEH